MSEIGGFRRVERVGTIACPECGHEGNAPIIYGIPEDAVPIHIRRPANGLPRVIKAGHADRWDYVSKSEVPNGTYWLVTREPAITDYQTPSGEAP